MPINFFYPKKGRGPIERRESGKKGANRPKRGENWGGILEERRKGHPWIGKVFLF